MINVITQDNHDELPFSSLMVGSVFKSGDSYYIKCTDVSGVVLGEHGNIHMFPSYQVVKDIPNVDIFINGE